MKGHRRHADVNVTFTADATFERSPFVLFANNAYIAPIARRFHRLENLMAKTRVISLLFALGMSLVSASVSAGGGGFAPQGAIREWSGQRFSVITIYSLDQYESLRARLESWSSSNRPEIAGLQSAIRANRSLSAALRARNVQINNIVAAQKAFNGALTFYLR